MNGEKQFKTVEDVELLILWMQAPPDAKPVVPFDAGAYLERLQLAVRWLYEHMSVRRVWPMMYEHFKHLGLKYSQSTARRDVADAQRLFCTDGSHDPKFWTDLMIDALSESFKSAQRAHKYGEAARLAKALLDWINMGIRLGAIDGERPEPPKQVVAVLQPGKDFTLEADTINQVQYWIEQREAKAKAARRPATDAEYTEDGTARPA